MRLLVFLTTATVTVGALSAGAADLGQPSVGGYKDGYIPGPSWTGFYLGVNGGYANADWKGKASDGGNPANLPAPNQTFVGTGGFGGGQIGYNKQINAYVLGIEADIEGSDLNGKGRITSVNFGGGAGMYDKDHSMNLDYFGTVRGRLGYALGNTLPYVTGGFAWGHATGDITVTHNPFGGPFVLADKGSVDEDHTGWVIGGGIETMITPSWTLKAEYQHLDLGSKGYAFKGQDFNNRVAGQVVPYTGDSFASDLTVDTFRVGLNYKFGNYYEPLK